MFLSSYATVHQVAKATSFKDAGGLHGLFSRQATEPLSIGQPLFFEGDEAKHVFEVVEGVLRIFRIVSDGRRVITGFLYAGDIVGFSLKDLYPYTAEAIAATKIRRLPRVWFEDAVAESDDLRPELFSRVCDEMAAAQDQLVLLSSKTAEERLCTFLLKHLRRSRAAGSSCATIDLPMSRQDMADYLGLTIETVSRTITKLISKGVVNVTNPAARHLITIEKPSMLGLLTGDTCECPNLACEGKRTEPRSH